MSAIWNRERIRCVAWQNSPGVEVAGSVLHVLRKLLTRPFQHGTWTVTVHCLQQNVSVSRVYKSKVTGCVSVALFGFTVCCTTASITWRIAAPVRETGAHLVTRAGRYITHSAKNEIIPTS